MSKIIVFDFDGTIVDSNSIKRNTFFKVLDPYELPKESIRKFVENENLSRSEIFYQLLKNIPKNEIDRCIDKYSRYVLDFVGSLELNDFFLEIIEIAKQKQYYIVLSSNTPEIELIKATKKLNIFRLFDEIHGYPKFKNETIRKLISKKNINPKDVIVIGDGESDSISSKLNNCSFFKVIDNSLFEVLNFIKNVE